MEISVIMLTYNRKDYVKRMIDAVLCQTFNNYEFIIVDNGSNDGTETIVDDYVNRDDRISVYHIEKSGISHGRNYGLSKAKGKYIAYVDDDDYIEPDYLEFLYTLIKENDSDIAVCGSYRCDDGFTFTDNCVWEHKEVMSPQKAIYYLFERKYMKNGMCSKLFKKSLFEDLQFSENRKADDIDMTYKLLAKANHITFHGIPKYVFYRHISNSSNYTTNYKLLNPRQLDEYFEVYRERTIYLSNLFPEMREYIEYSHWSYLISMIDKIKRNNLVECGNQLNYAVNTLLPHINELYYSIHCKEFEKVYVKEYFSDKLEELL